MKFRKKLNKSYNKKVFSRGVKNVHAKNLAPRLMRGGTRL